MKKESGNKTTTADFEVFKTECEYWIRYFGLIEYRVDFYHRELDGVGETNVNTNRSDMVASISLGICWKNMDVSDFMIRQTAFHEVVELLTWEYGDIIWNKTGQEYERTAAHRLIRRLENSVFKESYDRRYGNTDTAIDTKRIARNKRSNKRSRSLRNGNKQTAGKK